MLLLPLRISVLVLVRLPDAVPGALLNLASAVDRAPDHRLVLYCIIVVEENYRRHPLSPAAVRRRSGCHLALPSPLPLCLAAPFAACTGWRTQYPAISFLWAGRRQKQQGGDQKLKRLSRASLRCYTFPPPQLPILHITCNHPDTARRSQLGCRSLPTSLISSSCLTLARVCPTPADPSQLRVVATLLSTLARIAASLARHRLENPTVNKRRQIRLPKRLLVHTAHSSAAIATPAAFHVPVVCCPQTPALAAVFRLIPIRHPTIPTTCPSRLSRIPSAAADLSATLLTSPLRQKAPIPQHPRPSESSKGRTRAASIPWMAPKGN